ncbi:MAG: DciA family protein [Rickettsiales bacterium]|jgi:hypothetical protein|nr:DciA family protein [Rickettsiales bacterium]
MRQSEATGYQNKFKSFQYYSRTVFGPLLKNPRYSFLYLVCKNWEDIVEPNYKHYCRVEKVTLLNENKQGNLYIISFNSSTSFYLNNNKQYIIEKINTLFGYGAVSNLFIKEIPRIVKVENKTPVNVIFDNVKRKKIDDIIGGIVDDTLKGSLKMLGEELCKVAVPAVSGSLAETI